MSLNRILAMSAKKRRIKRKLARLCRLDADHGKRYYLNSKRRDSRIAMLIWYNGVVALGNGLQRKGHKAWEHIDKHRIWGSNLATLYGDG